MRNKKFTIIIIIAIIAGGALGAILANKGSSKAKPPVQITSSGTKSEIKNAGDVLKKLDDLAK